MVSEISGVHREACPVGIRADAVGLVVQDGGRLLCRSAAMPW